MSLPRPPLLLITDRRNAAHPLAEVVAAALDGGCRWIMLREKDLATTALSELAGAMVALAAGSGATIVVNGDVAAARAAKAAGVHLPRGGDVAAARAALGAGALVGVSAHDAREAAAAAAQGADYITLSPVFATASKPGYGPALGPAGLAGIARGLALPVLALGGITPGRVAACRAQGAGGVAVMGAVMRAADPGAVVAAFCAALADRPG